MEQLFAILALEALRRFIEQKHFRRADGGTGHEHQALVNGRNLADRNRRVFKTQVVQSFASLGLLFPRNVLSAAEVRRKACAKHIQKAQIFAVLESHFRREESEFCLVVPDVEAMSRTFTEERNVVVVNLRMVSGKHAEERTLASTVLAHHRPMFTLANRPVQILEHIRIAKTNVDMFQVKENF